MPQILLKDEKGIAADRALRRVLDGDSACGSVYESDTGRGGQNATVEGDKAQAAKAQTQPPRMEPPQADAQAFLEQSVEDGATAHDRRPSVGEGSSAKRFTQSLGGGATAHDRRSSGGEGSARGSSPERFAGLSVSVRAKIDMFERTARSLAGKEPNLKAVTGKSPQPRSLSRSLSEKVRAHESAISAATTSKGLPAGFKASSLSRSQSYQIPVRASPLPTITATTDAT